MEIIWIYFTDENGQLWRKKHKAYNCPHCESNMEFNESDCMRSDVNCSMCDYHYWVNIKSLEHAEKVEKK